MTDTLFKYLILILLVAIIGIQSWSLKIQSQTFGVFLPTIGENKNVEIKIKKRIKEIND
jgi:hypothetical protein